MESGIDVVVPSYRRPLLLQRCLAALADQSLAPRRVIVVLREGDEESFGVVEALRAGHLALEVVLVSEPGVLAAMRAGVSASSAGVVAFIDDDAEADPHWLEGLARLLESPGVGGVGGRDLLPDQSQTLTLAVGVFDRWGRLLGNHHRGMGRPRNVNVLKGVNMAFRVEALALPGPGLLRGKGAEVHFEEVMCAWATQRGWTLVYDPSVTVHHEGAPRLGHDQRQRPSPVAVHDAAHNYLIALRTALTKEERHAHHSLAVTARRAILHSLVIGTRSEPSVGRAVVALIRREREVVRRTLPSLRGKAAALRRFSEAPLVLSADTLRANNVATNAPSIEPSGARDG